MRDRDGRFVARDPRGARRHRGDVHGRSAGARTRDFAAAAGRRVPDPGRAAGRRRGCAARLQGRARADAAELHRLLAGRLPARLVDGHPHGRRAERHLVGPDRGAVHLRRAADLALPTHFSELQHVMPVAAAVAGGA